MSSSILHRDFLEPLEHKALFFLQQKNLPLEEMSPERARRLLREILFQHLEELQLYHRYLAGAFIFEFIRKNGRHYNRKNFEKSWKWLIQEKREDHPALNHILGLAGEKEEEAILQMAVCYWYHFRLCDEKENVFEVMPVPKQDKGQQDKPLSIKVSFQEKLRPQKTLPASLAFKQKILQKSDQKVSFKKS